MSDQVPDGGVGLTAEEKATVAEFTDRSGRLSDDELSAEAAVVLGSARRAAEMGDEASAGRALMGLSILLDEAERRDPGTRLALEARLSFRQHEALGRLTDADEAKVQERDPGPGDGAER